MLLMIYLGLFLLSVRDRRQSSLALILALYLIALPVANASELPNENLRPVAETLWDSTVYLKSPFLTVLTLNSNRASSATITKLIQVIDIISRRKPSIFILTEMTFDSIPSLLREYLTDYQYFNTVPSAERRNSGIIIGVIKDIPCQQSIAVTIRHQQTILPVMLQLQENHGSPLSPLLIVGIYAPQTRDTADALTSGIPYWNEVSDMLKSQTNGRWIISGDMNMILGLDEVDRGHRLENYVYRNDANAYKKTLEACSGVDLWRLKARSTNLDVAIEFTRSGLASSGIFRTAILDRTAAGPNIPSGTIETILTTIVECDHRPIWSQFSIPITIAASWPNTPRRRRLIKPTHTDSQFDELKEILTQWVSNTPNLSSPIRTEATFAETYGQVDQIFKYACSVCFDRPKVKKPNSNRLMTSDEFALQSLITFYDKAHLAGRSATQWEFMLKQADRRRREHIFANVGAEHDNESRSKCSTQKKILTRKLRDLVSTRHAASLVKNHRAKAILAIRTGSAKKILPNQRVVIPPYLRRPDGSLEIEPLKVIEAWREDTTDIYAREDPPPHTKPWLNTNSSHRFRRGSSATPFLWPQLMTNEDTFKVLSSGNPSPAPGPDDWEKWALRRSGTEFLAIITNLVNYTLTNNHFPPILKENLLIPIYKRGDFMQSTNYRGITLANTLQIISASWLQSCLQKYSNVRGFIPTTQSAGRKGAKQSDQIHLLHALDGYLRVTNLWCYALKRDRKKGFDFLHSSGFGDALTFFGIPESVELFENARARNVSLTLKVRDELALPILTSGLTKQGDPMSPLKYALTLSMAQWWIDDNRSMMGITVYTKRKNIHTAADTVERHIRMIAATDDTLVLATSLQDLECLTGDLEDFQSAYNMETEWTKPQKTTLMLMGRPSVATQSSPVTITINRAGQKVTLSPTAQKDRRFLNTPINSPHEQARILKDIMNSFVFPKPGRTLPITAIRRLTEISIMSKIKARLEMHPVSKSSAIDLRKLLNSKIRNYYGWPYHPKHDVLFSSLEEGGLDFTDPVQLNAMSAILPVHRLLNLDGSTAAREVTDRASMMEVCYTELQCRGKYGNHCWPPIGIQDPSAAKWKTKRNKASFYTWEIASQYAEEMGVTLFPSRPSSWAPHAEAVSPLTQEFTSQFSDSLDYLWQDEEFTIQDKNHLIWATDGSAGGFPHTQDHYTSFAVVGPCTFSARLNDRSSTIFDAEVIALGMAIYVDTEVRESAGTRLAAGVTSRVLCDNLDAVRKAKSYLSSGTMDIQTSSASRHALRLLMDAIDGHPGQLSVEHVKAHTDLDTTETNLNREADRVAKLAKESRILFCLPRYTCDRFTLHVRDEGFLHTDLAESLLRIWKGKQHPRVFAAPKDGPLDRNIYEYFDRFMFTRSPNAYSVQLQLLLRSHQLATPAHNIERKTRDRVVIAAGITLCCLCERIPLALVSARHIFVECQGESAIRIRSEMKDEVGKAFRNLPVDHQDLANSILEDSTRWAEGVTMFWQGLLPSNFTYDPKFQSYYIDLNSHCLRTTARLWWAYQQAQKHFRNPTEVDPPARVQEERVEGQEEWDAQDEQDRLESSIRDDELEAETEIEDDDDIDPLADSEAASDTPRPARHAQELNEPAIRAKHNRRSGKTLTITFSEEETYLNTPNEVIPVPLHTGTPPFMARVLDKGKKRALPPVSNQTPIATTSSTTVRSRGRLRGRGRGRSARGHNVPTVEEGHVHHVNTPEEDAEEVNRGLERRALIERETRERYDAMLRSKADADEESDDDED